MFGLVADKLLAVMESIFIWIWESVSAPFKEIPTLKKLVFGEHKEGKLVWGTFNPSDLTDALSPVFYTMLTLSGFVLVALIVNYGIRIAGAPLNPGRRNETIEFVKDLIFVSLVLVNLSTLYDVLFSINSSVVNLFSGAYDSNLDEIRNKPLDDPTLGNGILGFLLVQLVLLGLTVWASFYYMMRKITLILLMAMGPVMLVFWLSPRFKSMTGAWFKELVGTIFVQSIHAFVFWTVAVISQSSDGLIETVIVYIIFIPIAESIRRLVGMGGDMQGNLSKAGAMMGIGALTGLYGAAKGAFSDKSVASTLQGAYKGIKNAKNGQGNGAGSGDGVNDDLKTSFGANPGGDSGTDVRTEKMLQKGDIVGRAGKAAFGMAGAIAGAGLGPVGSIAGASGGFAAGGVVGGVLGRGGAALGQGIASRFSKGLDEMKKYSEGSNPDLDESIANEFADRSTASWADEHRGAEMEQLRQRFPDASESEINSKFSDLQNQKRQGFYNQAKSNLKSAHAMNNGQADGQSMVDAATHGMTERWAADNKAAFFRNFDENNTRMPGESLENYNARKVNAFKNKKAKVAQGFQDAGNKYLEQNGGLNNEPVSISGFLNHLDKSAESIEALVGKDRAINLVSAGKDAVKHVTGANALNAIGVPDTQSLGKNLAAIKTAEMGNAYVNAQVEKGVKRPEALNDWNTNHRQSAYQKNLEDYQGSIDHAQKSISLNGIKAAPTTLGKIGAFTKGASGITPLASGFKNVIDAARGQNEFINESTRAMAATSMTLQSGERGAIGNFVRTAVPSLKAGIHTAAAQIAEGQGGAVEAQANYQNKAGYVGGLLFGRAGQQTVQNLAAKHSPFKQAVQSSIHSPGEIIQMAQTTTDDYGNLSVAPGAIRQVVTAQESYVEVMTQAGERKIVSRKGSGHSGMRAGDIVYQDLSVDGNNMLVANSPATYRLDSAGGRTKSSVQLVNDPATLLGNPRVSDIHQPAAKQAVPVYSQAVDNGRFYTSDLASSGFENIQVVVEKDRQFVTGQKGGQTYRVSQIFEGDARLQPNETIQVPVQVTNDRIVPTHAGSNVQVEAQLLDTQNTVSGQSAQQVVVQKEHVYVSSRGIEETPNSFINMVPSKHTERANRSANRRRQLDQARKPQGFMG